MIKIIDIKRVFWIILFKIVLDVSFIMLISPIWGYMGFTLQMNTIKLIESYILLVFMYIITPKSDNKISNIFIQFLYLMMIVPTLSLYAMKNESRVFLYSFFMGFFITITTVKIMPRIKLLRIKISSKIYASILALITLTTYFLIIKDNGLPTLGAMNLLNVYSIRGEFVTSIGIINYLLMWQAKIINPLLIGYFYYTSRYKGVFLVVLFQLALFLLTGHKAFLFSIILVIGSAYLVKKKKFYTTLLIGLTLMVLCCLLLGVLNISDYPASFITNRVLFVPAQNYFYYYDFFSNNQKVHLTQSVIGNLLGIKGIYDRNITYMIGQLYYNSPRMMVNTGYLADAYMNFGILGMWFFSLLLGLIFILIDQISKNINKILVVSAFIFPIYALVDGALQTALLTHGLLTALVLIYFIDSNKLKDIKTFKHTWILRTSQKSD